MNKINNYRRYSARGLCPKCRKPQDDDKTYCSTCRREIREKRAIEKPRPDFINCLTCGASVKANTTGVLVKYCKKCIRRKQSKRSLDRYHANHTSAKKYTKEYARKWRSSRREQMMDNDMRRKYGINLETFHELLVSQDNRCAICHTKFLSTKNADVPKSLWINIDHSHETGKVRGLLCTKCNLGLGSFSDNEKLLYSAANYLSLSKSKT